MKTVLLAYEREQDLATVETLLQSRGLQVVRVRSGIEAIEVARREAPHVVVSDVLLPKLDGFALCRRLHEDPLLAHLPVLLHSFRIEGTKYEAFAAEVGAAKFLPRGSKLEDLVEAVEEQLQGSGTVRMPALVPELLERRETDRRRLQELERRVHDLEASNRQLEIAERVAREAAEMAGRDREEAARSGAEALRAMQERLRETETRDRQVHDTAAQFREAAAHEVRAEQTRIALLETRLTEMQAGRARAQAAALDAERAFSAQPVPAWLVDMATCEIRAASDAAAALFGVSREALIGCNALDLLPGSTPGDDTTGPVEALLSRSAGAPLVLELRFRPVSFDGRACWITSARDVTEERAWQRMHETAARDAEAFEQSPAATCLVDEEGRLLQSNAAFRALLRLDAAAAAGASLAQFEVDESVEATTRHAAIGAGVRTRDCRWRRADGEVFDVEVATTLAGGQRVVTVQDLGEHRRALQRAEREQRCLAELLDLAQRAHSMTESELLARALAVAGGLTASPQGSMFLALPDPGQLELAASQGGPAEGPELTLLRRWRGAPPAGSILAESLASQQGAVRELPEDAGALVTAGLPVMSRRQLCAPLHDGVRVTGLMLLADKPEPYDADDRRHAARTAEVLARILRRRRSDAEVVGAMDHMERVMLGVIESLAGLAEAQDAGRVGRSRRVGELAAGIGSALGLPGHTVRGLRAMGQLIDVGMLHIPREILWRPGQLTPAEYELVKTHAERGHEILRGIDFPWPVAEVVRQHHERMDGSGYPRGLQGEAILLESRVVAVADAAEAMLAPRPQRAALSIPDCIEELQSQAGRRYDARVVKACVKLLRERDTRTEGEVSVGQRIA